METELTCNHSTSDFTGYLHLMNTSTESTGVKRSWTSAEIARFLQIIVRPILIILGTTGNGLTVYIMRRTSLKDVSSCFYMSILALADTCKSCSFYKTIYEPVRRGYSSVRVVHMYACKPPH